MKKMSLLSAAVLALFLAACSTCPSKPDWIMKGSAAFPKDKKTIYGVGMAKEITSESLRRTTSDNRAIAEVSKQVSVMSTSMMRDYMSSASAAEADKSRGEQYVESTVKTFSSNILAGVKITDRWDNGKSCYSLAALDVDNVKAAADKDNELSLQAKEYIKSNAEKALDKLDAEQSKQGK